MKTLPLVSIAFVCLLSNCQKPKDNPVPTPECTNPPQALCSENRMYYPLTKGSYWIYENSVCYPLQNARNIYSYDSCYIPNKDTIINGERCLFFTTVKTYLNSPPFSYNNYLRYEGDYVINEPNYKLFSACATNEILETKAWFYYTTELRSTEKDSVYTVPAGTFTARVQENRYLHSPVSPEGHGRYYTEYLLYAKNVGLIYDVTPYVNDATIVDERRLIRYHVE